MGREKYIVLGIVSAIVALAAVWFLVLAPGAPARPSFDLTDIDGEQLTSAGLRGQVVLLEFSGTWCEPCRIVEAGFKDFYPSYENRTVFISVMIPPANDPTSLENHRLNRGIPWHIAPDMAGNESLMLRFNVPSLPRVFVLNREGYVTGDWSPPIGFTSETVKRDVGADLDAALAGIGTPIELTAISIPALLVVAALLSFFSPCSFPVLPAFMAFYLKEEAKGGMEGKKASNAVAAGRGFVASLGIVTVYGIIALLVFAAGFAAQAVITALPPIIGVVLVTLGILTLLPFQYHWLTRPFIELKRRIAAKIGRGREAGMGTKLFAFGAGYGAAGFACVAPPFVGAVLNAAALGSPEQAILGLALYIGIVIGLMVVITVALHVAGDRALQKVKAWSGAMKYISAVALIIAGSYLLWLFLIAYVFTG